MSDDKAQTEYSTSLLRNGEIVPELWNENGDVLVFLYPKTSGRGSSFKVPEFIISSSQVFIELIGAESEDASRDRGRTGRPNASDARDGAQVTSSPLSEIPSYMRLYIPTAPPTASAHLITPGETSTAELDRVIAVRNLFASLTGQPLVGTKSKPTGI